MNIKCFFGFHKFKVFEHDASDKSCLLTYTIYYCKKCGLCKIKKFIWSYALNDGAKTYAKLKPVDEEVFEELLQLAKDLDLVDYINKWQKKEKNKITYF